MTVPRCSQPLRTGWAICSCSSASDASSLKIVIARIVQRDRDMEQKAAVLCVDALFSKPRSYASSRGQVIAISIVTRMYPYYPCIETLALSSLAAVNTACTQRACTRR
ncbi:hypothetical protein EXIGLDRAFT_478932 [Exidia glandulosa HHB12029]|uniref:Uncharacterized protein n=1 Tax=Exidia glandulosa HHB12029 TaxID=1314781 RepID=A0A165Z468_EXIGL|nr:hypothetical protein EXIGLDRAFT_478932 [Exidia glandulosa HHB12029]